MKMLRIKRRPPLMKVRWVVIPAMTVLFVFWMAIAFASSGGEDATEAKGWIGTDTYRVMNFVVLAAALFFLLRKPISEALSSRIKGIKEQLAELEAQKEEAEKQLAAYNEKLSRLEEEAEKIVADYIQQGKDAQARILKEAEETAEKLKAQARRNIDHEFERAKSQLQEEILDKALLQAEKIIKEKITDKDQNRLVDEYLDKVVA